MRASKDGIEIDAAVRAEGWDSPVAVSSRPGGVRRRSRMWSMSKPVAAVAALEAAGEASSGASTVLREAIERALRRSENCRQRRVVLGLQEMTGGPEAARRAVLDVLRRAGATGASVPATTQLPDASCTAYLERAGRGLAAPLGRALLLGTATWRVTDAAAMALALGTGRLGPAGDRVLALMHEDKRGSEEVHPGDFTAPLDWGAGRALARWAPAYKAGWGGVQQQRFVAGQLITLDVGAQVFGIAVIAHPRAQPSKDDPGRTSAPAAVERVLRRLDGVFGDLAVRGRR